MPVLKPGPPARPGVPGGAARRCAPDCCPVVAYGALLPRVGARHPRARLGQPALLLPARLARRGAGAARDLGRRRGHRRDDVPDRQGARRRADVRRDDRADPARRHRRRPARPGWPRAAPACWSPPSTGSPTARSRPASSRPTASASRPRSPSRTPQVDWTEPAVAVDRRIRACTPAPGAWTTHEGERIKLGPVAVGPGRRALAPGELRIGKREVLVGTGTDPVRLGEVKAFGKKQMPAADWARGARRPSTRSRPATADFGAMA